MAKSQQSFNKKEKEKKRLKKRKEKLERKEQRKQEKLDNGPKSFEDMLAYVDENGYLTSEKPDPTKKKKKLTQKKGKYITCTKNKGQISK